MAAWSDVPRAAMKTRSTSRSRTSRAISRYGSRGPHEEVGDDLGGLAKLAAHAHEPSVPDPGRGCGARVPSRARVYRPANLPRASPPPKEIAVRRSRLVLAALFALVGLVWIGRGSAQSVAA